MQRLKGSQKCNGFYPYIFLNNSRVSQNNHGTLVEYATYFFIPYTPNKITEHRSEIGKHRQPFRLESRIHLCEETEQMIEPLISRKRRISLSDTAKLSHKVK